MKTRLYKFYARTDEDADTTIVHDINIQDVISSIVLGFEFHKTGAVQTAHPMAAIKKIELIDGSDVLHSLDGFETEAVDWYGNGGKLRSNWNMQFADSTCSRYIGIKFGRWLWDEVYAFDPTRFVNPQLRIELDIDGWAATGDHIYVTGWSNIFDDRPSGLRGFLMRKEVKEYTMADDTHEYTDMPLDYTYRNLYFRPYKLGTEPNQCVQNVKLSEDMDKRIVFDHGAQEILRCVQEKYPDVHESLYFPVNTANRYAYITPTTRVSALAQVWAAAAVAFDPALYNGDGGRLNTITAANPSNTQIHVRGYVPHCVYEIPFGLRDDPASWYDVRSIRHLRLDIEGAAAATGYIYLEQERLY